MPIPDTLYKKTRGQAVRADDWNTGFAEVARLGTDKVNKAGDTMTGPLDVKALTVDNLTVTQAVTLQSPLGLGLARTDITKTMQINSTWSLALDQWPAGLAPPGFPAYFVIRSITPAISFPPQSLAVYGERADTTTVGGVAYIRRIVSLSLSGSPQGDVADREVQLSVFRSAGSDGFTPTLTPA